MKRDFKGVWIPAQVWLDKELTAIQKVLLAEIDSFTSRDQVYFKSNETIAEEMGCSVSTVKRSVQHLISLGYAERVSFDGRRRALRSKLTLAEGSKRPDSQVKWTQQTVQFDPADRSEGTTKRTKRKPKKNTKEEVVMPFPEMGEIWSAWIGYRRKEHRFSYKSSETEQTAIAKLAELSNYNAETARQIVEQSIVNGWRGLFELKRTNKQSAKATPADVAKFESYIRTGRIDPNA